MKENSSDLLAHRLNFDAIVFCGCTMKEMQLIGLISLIICIFILGFITKFLFNMFMIGMGLAFPAAIGMSWIIAMVFQKAKFGKPKGYVKQRFLLWCEDKHFIKSGFIRYSGKWSVGR